MDTKVLREIGFSDGEIKVYFALLELGQTTIGPISKQSNVTAAKVYPILEKLSKKGLSSKVIKSGTMYFEAAEPKRIIDYLDDRTKGIEQQKKEIKNLIPKILLNKKLSSELPKAKVYQSFDGMKTLYNEILDKLGKNDFIGFTLGEEEYSYPESKSFFEHYDLVRKEKGIKVRLLAHSSKKKIIEKFKYKNIEYRYLDIELPTGVLIYENSVATMVWSKMPTAFVIESKQVASAYRKFFEDMWKIAKK